MRIGRQLEDFLVVDLITIDYHKTKTNIITTANENVDVKQAKRGKTRETKVRLVSD